MKRLLRNTIPAVALISAICSAVFLCAPDQARAEQKVNAAVVAGFIQTFQEIASAFEAQTGIKVDVSFSSAGRLYGQIVNGAPYDIFLSADTERPDLLYGKAITEKPFVYVVGAVVLWSSQRAFCASGDWRSALRRSGIRKIAIANPETGVHGDVAKKALEEAGLWTSLLPKLVYAQDMAQVFQYASEGTVDAAFCSRALTFSEKGKKGCYYEMKDAPAVVYSGCVIRKAQNHEAAERFAEFLLSPEVEKIKEKYRYKRTTGKR